MVGLVASGTCKSWCYPGSRWPRAGLICTILLARRGKLGVTATTAREGTAIGVSPANCLPHSRQVGKHGWFDFSKIPQSRQYVLCSLVTSLIKPFMLYAFSRNNPYNPMGLSNSPIPPSASRTSACWSEPSSKLRWPLRIFILLEIFRNAHFIELLLLSCKAPTNIRVLIIFFPHNNLPLYLRSCYIYWNGTGWKYTACNLTHSA